MKRARMPLILLSCAIVACSSADDSPSNSSAEGGATGQGGADTGGGQSGGGSQDGGAGSPSPDAPACTTGGLFSEPLDVPAQAVIVTSEDLAASFQPYAHLHTLLGTTTAVVTTQEICAGACDDDDPRNDTPAHVKQWIVGQPSLRYVILGGDIEHVPSREVFDRYQHPILVGYTFEQDFFTDYYYAEFSEWDANADGVYAQDGVDAPDYRPEIAVSRIPVSNAEEAALYLEKVLRYLSSYEVAHTPKMLMLSNVATQVAGMDIDGAWYFEGEGRTLSLLPNGSEVRKLYSTGIAGAEVNTADKQVDAMEAGQNIIVHSGHGGVNYLTTEIASSETMTGQMAFDLQNDTYPILLSSACEAATFSAEDSAGELLMNAPEGGAIAYLGNAAVGLGLAGGMQMIDELLRFVQQNPHPLLGDALLFAHENMPEHDMFRVPVGNFDVPVVDKSSYEWTQKAVTFFGDILIPVRTGPLDATVDVKADTSQTCEGLKIVLSFDPPINDLARVHAGDSYYEVLVVDGRAELHLPQHPDSIGVGLASPGAQATLAELPL